MIAWLEAEFEKAGVKKVIPNDLTLKASYRNAAAAQLFAERSRALKEQCERDAQQIKPPPGLKAKVRAAFDDDAARPWNAVIMELAKGGRRILLDESHPRRRCDFYKTMIRRRLARGPDWYRREKPPGPLHRRTPDEMISIPNHPQLIAELSMPLAQRTASGKIKIESKDDMHRRGLKSPNYADALVLAFHAELPVDVGRGTEALFVLGTRAAKGGLVRTAGARPIGFKGWEGEAMTL